MHIDTTDNTPVNLIEDNDISLPDTGTSSGKPRENFNPSHMILPGTIREIDSNTREKTTFDGASWQTKGATEYDSTRETTPNVIPHFASDFNPLKSSPISSPFLMETNSSLQEIDPPHHIY